jgi:hypothetical protein
MSQRRIFGGGLFCTYQHRSAEFSYIKERTDSYLGELSDISDGNISPYIVKKELS